MARQSNPFTLQVVSKNAGSKVVSSDNGFDENWRQIRTVRNENTFFYKVFGGFILVVFGLLLGNAFFGNDAGYAINLYTSFLSIAVTVFIVDLLAKRRDEQREERQLKKRLMRDLKGSSNEAAIRAVDEIRENGWLSGKQAMLRGSYLTFTNLQGANFNGADLEGTYFVGANLKEASFSGANLKRTQLIGANLEGAWLATANLQNAWLHQSKLHNANMTLANLENLNWGDELNPNEVDETTVMPDGNFWYRSIDMMQFIDPKHLKFWRPIVQWDDDGLGFIPVWYAEKFEEEHSKV